MAAKNHQLPGHNKLVVLVDESTGDTSAVQSNLIAESTKLVITSAGEALHSIDNIKFSTHEGDLLIIPRQRNYMLLSRDSIVGFNYTWKDCETGIPQEQLRSIPGYMAMFILEPIYRNLHRVEKTLHLEKDCLGNIIDIQKAIHDELQNRESGFEIAVNSLFLQLVIKLSRYYTRNDDPERQALLRLGIVIQAMETETSRHWTIDDLTNLAEMSESTLFKIFREATGYTPIEYLIRIRLQYCMDQLASTDKPINDIAHDSGFRDGNYFSRQFRKHTGVSPRDYRRNHRETSQA